MARPIPFATLYLIWSVHGDLRQQYNHRHVNPDQARPERLSPEHTSNC